MIPDMRKALLLLVTCAALATAQAPRQPVPPSPPPSPSDSLIRIVLLTMGPGDQVYEFFGHNAIWVHDPRSGEDMVYNWGVFDFRTPGFIGRFLLGDMRYMMVGEDIQYTLGVYQYLNRHVTGQELDLTGPEKRALVDFIHWNVRPENSQYRYDYYLDNCSTRVRDAIDRVVGGQLRRYLQGIETGETYRGHSLRLMQNAPLLVTGVEIALGRPTDVPLTADQTSFLPGQLMKYVRDLKLDGGTRPLVRREFTMYEATRGPEPATVPSLWKALLPVGALVGVVIAGVFFGVRSRRGAAVLVALVAGLIGLIGTVIVLLVTITDHVAAHANENMLLINPVWLIAAVAIPWMLLKGKARGVARWSGLVGVALSAVAVLMHLVGTSQQPNWDVIGLVLPAQFVIAAIGVGYWFGRPVSDAGRAKSST